MDRDFQRHLPKVGNFTAQFNGIYWYEDKKDLLKPIELMASFIVEESSPNPYNHDPTNSQQLNDILNVSQTEKFKKSYGFESISSLIVLLFCYAKLRFDLVIKNRN